MQIGYVWIDNFTHFQHKEFLFTSQYSISMKRTDNKNKLEVSRKKSIQNILLKGIEQSEKNEHESVSNLTAIVGKNGSGKSTFLRLLLQIVQNEVSFGYIAVFLPNKNEDKDNELWIYKNKNADEITVSEGIKWKLIDESIDKISDTSLIFYSNAFDGQYLFQNIDFHKAESKLNVFDISVNKLLYQINGEKPINKYFHDEFQKQLEFVCRNSTKNNELRDIFKLPQSLIIRLIEAEKVFSKLPIFIDMDYKKIIHKDGLNIDNDIKKINSEEKAMDSYIRVLWEIINKLSFASLEEKIESSLLISLFYLIGEKEYKKLAECYGYIKDGKKITLDVIGNWIKVQDNKFSSKNECLKFIRDAQKLVDLFSKYQDIFKSESGKYIIDITKQKNLEVTITLNSLYRKVNIYSEFLYFEWPLSTGEFYFLCLFSRLFSVLPNNDEKKETFPKKIGTKSDVIVIIDEADLSLHPRWQQQYINKLLIFFKICFSSYSVQLILATHSPIILSDIPRDNTIYLELNNREDENNRRGETFASNIYNIYKDYYFLKTDSIGIIGDFANEILKKVDTILNEICEQNTNDNIESKLEFCEQVINAIGDPLIKKILIKRYCRVKSSSLNNSNKSVVKIEETYRTLNDENKRRVIEFILSEK